MKLLLFNIRKKWKRIPVLILLGILSVFICTQEKAIFHYPVRNDADIHKLEECGERDFLYIEKTDDEVKSQLRQIIEKTIDTNNEDDNIKRFQKLLVEIDDYSIDELIDNNREDGVVYAYLMNSINEIDDEYEEADNINNELLEKTHNQGYQIEFQNNYITYTQAIIAFLLIVFVILIVDEDERYRIRESMGITADRYLHFYYMQLCTLIVPIIVFTYALGAGLNFYSYMKFYIAGYYINYVPISVRYWSCFVPTLLCFSSVLIYIVYKVKNYMSVMPVYLMWVIFNVTPHATRVPVFLEHLIVLKRLDMGDITDNHFVFKRVLIVIVSLLIYVISYRKNLEEIN
ncbi:MAG: hypothetical protein HUJ68_10520 [Clostridia bacterium]|nr:hypothetical protein [Clostridia bacterium]